MLIFIDEQTNSIFRSNNGEPLQNPGIKAIQMILNECIPLFNILMNLKKPSKELIEKVLIFGF